MPESSERRYFVVLGAVAAVVVFGIVAFWANASSDEGGEERPAAPVAERTSVVEVTESPVPTVTPSVQPTASPVPTEPSPTEPPATPTPVPSVAPAPPTSAARLATREPQVQAPEQNADAVADFNGTWRIIDTVTEGAGAGQTFTFDIVLVQTGSAVQGGNFEITMMGTVEGNSATLQFTQPGGITGTFSWTMDATGNAGGTFQTSVPNGGASQLVRIP